MPNKVYRMPSTANEREGLIKEISAEVLFCLGEVREANLERWMAMPLNDLAIMRENWRKLAAKKREKEAAVPMPPKKEPRLYDEDHLQR